MKPAKTLLTIVAACGLCVAAKADLLYTFDTDVEGFTGVSWQPYPDDWATKPTIQLGFTGTPGSTWHQAQIKEFTYEAGGGAADQQAEMQRLANKGNARISFDLVADFFSYPNQNATWDQTYIIGNSDGTAGWSQNQLLDVPGWAPGYYGTTWSGHFDLSFAQMGWQPGDTFFQLTTVVNSGDVDPINFYFDNVRLYEVVPEPASFGLIGLGALVFALRRRMS